MSVSDEELDFDHHLALYRSLFTGDPKKDAFWYREAENIHALSVSDAIRDAHVAVVILAQSIRSAEARMQLNFGAGHRTKFIWLSLRNLIELVHPERTEPLLHDDVDEVAQDLNVIYINIRGALDNLARCLLDLFGEEKTKRLPPMHVHLFGDRFLKDANLSEAAKLMGDVAEWNGELKTRRDPAAHRIPLTVPPSVLDDAAVKEYKKISAEYTEAFNAAVKTVREGGDSSALFEKSDGLYEKLQRVGTFAPVFVHHPDEGAMNIYPVVPEDVGQLVKIVRILTKFISDRLGT